MDEDDEDYQALFFTECVELLGELQEQLDQMANGDDDPEVVNAAFRAVHSVKGGAAAFGFNDLIGFAHVFETVMDRVRNDVLAVTPEISSLLLRAGDVLTELVENARDGGEPDRDMMDRVAAELHDAAGTEAPEPKSAPSAETEPDAETVILPEELPERTVTVDFCPHPGFLAAGHDPLKVIRAARRLGSLDVVQQGEIPPLAELDLSTLDLKWAFTFESSEPPKAFQDFFEIYEAFADVSITDEGPEEPAAPAAAEAPKTPPSQPVASPAEPAEPQEAKGQTAPKRKVARTLRVELPRIDRLVNLVGETVITQAVLAQRLSEIDLTGNLELSHAVESMARQTRELQESVMAIRAQPIKSVFSRMPRVVRDLAEKLGKEAKLEVSGEQTEVDMTVIEELAEPLTHMLRNSMDHGLEETPEDREAVGKPRVGTLRLAAEHRGERVIISVSDDGRGINRDVVHRKAIERGLVDPSDTMSPEEIDHLIFHPGFSTAAEVSSVSGRGVGMDVVKKKIQALGGRCIVKNTPGQGANFMITLPLTLAVLDGMIVVVGDERFILPIGSVVEAIKIEDERVSVLPHGQRLIKMRDDYVPLVSLNDLFQVHGGCKSEDLAILVDTETGGSIALLVDELIGQRQVVLKSLEANFQRVAGVSGATILGDGRVALILDVSGLQGMADELTQSQQMEIAS
ncbi:MAG: chemotaxis protein CheA [Pseudomonadota bacterium]